MSAVGVICQAGGGCVVGWGRCEAGARRVLGRCLGVAGAIEGLGTSGVELSMEMQSAQYQRR